MAMVYRNYDPRFSTTVEKKVQIQIPSRPSYTKHIERQIVHAWKTVTRATRKQRRASRMPQDFVLVTSRRRSALVNAA
ncbi:hypothetical protein AX16_006569 [Volvariella volvacea WC 439]|nr:hypothetical protein AX16_006569 [Volvariella volvacea WC 439]